MDLNIPPSPGSSTASSTTTPSTAIANATATPTPTANSNANSDDPMHTWWESVSKARSHIHSLSSFLSPSAFSALSPLADSDRPALSLLSSSAAYASLSSALSSPFSGSGSDPLCHWLYDTFLSNDPHLRLVVLSYVPLISGIYLSRLHSSSHEDVSQPSLAGFEAVLLAIYASETKSRAGKPVVVNIPDLAQPSMYHTPRQQQSGKVGGGGGGGGGGGSVSGQSVGVIWPPLEPQIAVKSTKRAFIVGVVLDCFFKQISQMPSWSKIEFCEFLAAWAGQDCCCRDRFDESERGEGINGGISMGRFLEYADDEDDDEVEIKGVEEEMGRLRIENGNANGHGSGDLSGENRVKGVRIPLPWELLQPSLRILGHCLLGPLNSQDVKDAASVAVRSLFARASHDLNPQVILATRSLIQLDKRAREAAKVAAVANASSSATTPSKAKKPEVLLVSK